MRVPTPTVGQTGEAFQDEAPDRGVAGIVFAEKVLPIGERVAQALAIALVAFGIWWPWLPTSSPG
jgi:hypothetical protein